MTLNSTLEMSNGVRSTLEVNDAKKILCKMSREEMKSTKSKKNCEIKTQYKGTGGGGQVVMCLKRTKIKKMR